MSQNPPTPEEFTFGLQQGEHGLEFLMPVLETEQNLMSYLLESGRAIATAATVRLTKHAVRLIPGGSVLVEGYEIVAAELFDTTMLDMAKTIGYVATDAGILQLQDARNEPDPSRKNTHRNRAAQSFETSFAALRRQIGEEPTGFEAIKAAFTSPETAGLHRQATAAAVIVALINHYVDHQTAAQTWAGYAGEHFGAYRAVRYHKAQLLTEGRDLQTAQQYTESTKDYDGSRDPGETAAVMAENVGRIALAGALGALKHIATKGRPGAPPLIASKILAGTDFSTKNERAKAHQAKLARIAQGIQKMQELDGQAQSFARLQQQLTAG